MDQTLAQMAASVVIRDSISLVNVHKVGPELPVNYVCIQVLLYYYMFYIYYYMYSFIQGGESMWFSYTHV